MTLRHTIAGLVEGPTADTEPGAAGIEAALADEGFADLPAEAFGTALANYADTAPMDHADALAPIVTALGPTPEVSPLVDDAADRPLDAFELFETHPPHVETPTDDVSPTDEGVDDDMADLLDAFGSGQTLEHDPAEHDPAEPDLADDTLDSDLTDSASPVSDDPTNTDIATDVAADLDLDLDTDLAQLESDLVDDDLIGEDPADLDFDA